MAMGAAMVLLSARKAVETSNVGRPFNEAATPMLTEPLTPDPATPTHGTVPGPFVARPKTPMPEP
jgi:hypothetical protein